jgi:hypothetical protein
MELVGHCRKYQQLVFGVYHNPLYIFIPNITPEFSKLSRLKAMRMMFSAPYQGKKWRRGRKPVIGSDCKGSVFAKPLESTVCVEQQSG